MTAERTAREAAYDDLISPLIDKIIEKCKERDIPLIAVFGLAGDDAPHLVASTSLPYMSTMKYPENWYSMPLMYSQCVGRINHDTERQNPGSVEVIHPKK